MITSRIRIALIVAALAMWIAACDDDEDDASLTVGAPPSTSEEGAPDGDGDLEGLDDDSRESGGVEGAVHGADIPEGTDEQQSKFTRARAAFLDDDLDEAEALFKELALEEQVTSETLSSAIALAQIYVETGRPEEAEELFDSLLEHAGDLPEVLLVLGRVYADLDRHEMALGAFERAYEQQQDYIFILPEMAEILLRNDEEDKAAQLLLRYEDRLEKMVKMVKDTDETPDRTRLYLVDILSVVHDESAHQALKTALASDPVATIRAEAAVALGELGAFDARDTLQKAAVDDEAEAVRNAARHALERLREIEEAAPSP